MTNFDSPDAHFAHHGKSEIIEGKVNGRDVIDIQPASRWAAPDMSILAGGVRAAPPLPLDLFGDHASREITLLAEAKGAPSDYVAGGMLAVAAALIGNSRWIEAWAGWREPPALWIGAVGDPSAGKSPALDPALQIAREIEDELAGGFNETIRRWETDCEAAKIASEAWRDDLRAAHAADAPAPTKPERASEPDKPARPRIIAQDATTEALAEIAAGNPKGALLFRDELSGFLSGCGRYGNEGDRPFFLEAWGGRPFVVDRKKNATPLRISLLNFSILGGIQPDRLSSLLLEADDDGLAARFLFVWPRATPPIRPTRAFDLDPLRRAFRRLHGLTLIERDGMTEPGLLRLDDAAASLHQKNREALFVRSRGAHGMFASALGKYPGIALRLAGVLCLLDWAFCDGKSEPAKIEAETIRRAWRLLTEYFEPMARRVYGDAAIPQVDRDAAALGREILKRRDEIVNAREIRHRWGIAGLRTAERVDAALRALEEANWLRPAPARRGASSGRQAKTFSINPRVFEHTPAVPASESSDSPDRKS